jgi:hypothetical protein
VRSNKEKGFFIDERGVCRLRHPLTTVIWEFRRRDVSFLRIATAEMASYRAKTGRYASEWFELGFWWHLGNYGRDEHGRMAYGPKPKDGPSWRPVDSNQVFVIRRADERSFVIEATDLRGEAFERMGSEDPSPVLLRDPPCRLEPVALDLEAPAKEAAVVMEIAAMDISAYPKICGHAASSWEEINTHFAIEAHTEDDPRASPPAGAGRAWKPWGAKYTYLLEINGSAWEIRTTNDLGLPNYRQRTGDKEPELIRPTLSPAPPSAGSASSAGGASSSGRPDVGSKGR